MDKITDNTKGFHYTIIDNYILSCADLNALEQIVYVHLKKYSSQDNKCFPGINRLAETVGLSDNTIRKTLRSLRDKGFIDIQQRFNKSNEYTLLPYPEYLPQSKNEDNTFENEIGIAKVLQSYQNNINPLYGSMERDKLISWYETFDDNTDILVKAIEMAILQGVRKIKYIDSILLNWHQRGIKTLEQCEAYLKEWEEKRRESQNGAGGFGKDKESDTSKRYDFSKFGDI